MEPQLPKIQAKTVVPPHLHLQRQQVVAVVVHGMPPGEMEVLVVVHGMAGELLVRVSPVKVLAADLPCSIVDLAQVRLLGPVVEVLELLVEMAHHPKAGMVGLVFNIL
jgi:hypothetical protein